MKQSSFIVGALLAAFVLFIAARGRLPLYASVVWGPKPEPAHNSGGGFSLPGFPNLGGGSEGGGSEGGGSDGGSSSRSRRRGSTVLIPIPGIPFPIPVPIPNLGDIFG